MSVLYAVRTKVNWDPDMILIQRLFEMPDLVALLRRFTTQPAKSETRPEPSTEDERARREILFELLSQGHTTMHNKSDLQALMVRYPRHF